MIASIFMLALPELAAEVRAKSLVVKKLHAGVHFVANTNKGVNLVDTTVWDEPPVQNYDPAIPLNPGDSIAWTCTYNNETGAPLVLGDSAEKNEMCIYLARFYSAPSGNDIECQSPSANGIGAVTDNVPQ